MQLLEALRVALLEARAEELGEQVVEAVPLALAIQRQEEQLHGLQPLQQGLAVLASGQGVGEVAGQLRRHAQGQQHFLHLRRQLLEHRAQQMVAERHLIAADRGHRRRPLRLVTQQQAAQLDADHPALGLHVQGIQRLVVQHQAVADQVVAGFLPAQAQFVGADFQQQVLGPPGGELERRPATTADRQGEPLRGQFDQPVEHAQQLAVLHQVEVVEHQQQRVGVATEVGQQAFHHRGHRHLQAVPEKPQGLHADAGQRFVQGLDQVRQEARGVVVLGAQRQPCDAAAATSTLFGQGRQCAGLAESGRRREQQQPGMGMSVQRRLDARSRQIVGGGLGGRELGAQQATGSWIQHNVHAFDP
ncbi:hypothetical protein FQZ97_636410 [compost metagenome]